MESKVYSAKQSGGPKDFTDRELDIMSVLWREGSGTVEIARMRAILDRAERRRDAE